MKVWMADMSLAKGFFFHSSPSWLLPGRNTVFVSLKELCNGCIFLYWGVKREHGPVHSPTCPNWSVYQKQKAAPKQNNQFFFRPAPLWLSPGRRSRNKTTKLKTHNNNTKTSKNNHKTHRRDDGRALSKRGSLCANELRRWIRSCEKQTSKTRHHSKIAMKVQNQLTVRKPRIPPARIPEIAPWSPQGITAPSNAWIKIVQWIRMQTSSRPCAVVNPNK